MRKTATKLTKVRVNGRRFYCITWPKIGKGRNRRFFKDKSEAETVLHQKLIEKENYGTVGVAFTESQRSEYLESCEILSRFGVTIRDAVKFYLPHLQAANRSCTVAELARERLAVKTADGASARYLADLRSRLGQFAATFGTKPVAEITATEVDNWLRSLSDSTTGRCLSPTTRNNFRRVLISTFNFARSRGYCVENPAAKSAKAKQIDSPVGILSVEELARLLENAPSDLIPYVAIGAFAGLRSAELERLDWKEIDLQSDLIEVTASKAKSARRRLVRIQTNLAEWLKLHQERRGDVTPRNYRDLLDMARTAARIQRWPHNALRHSFASYHLCHFKDAAALALELGHTNSNIVFQHYREVVKPKQAERYWNIRPASVPNVVAMTA
jgi:integrase